MPEDTEAQVARKILGIDMYIHQHPEAENLTEALELGEYLEYKREFLQCGSSLFRLRKFALRETPFKAEAEERIELLRKGYVLPEEPKEEDVDPVSLRQAPLIKESPQTTHTDANTFTDPRDGQVYPTVKLNGLVWLARNLNFDVGEGCWFYDNDPKNGVKYGRLYTWRAAQRACPPGWRLPTDKEWQRLATAFGGYYDLKKSKGIGDPRRAYQALVEDGGSGFSALLGGYQWYGSFSHLDVEGHYWSDGEYSDEEAWCYKFDRSYVNLYRTYCSMYAGRSCRCVQA